MALKEIIVRTWADIDALTREQLEWALIKQEYDPSLEPQKYDGGIENYISWEVYRKRFDDAVNAKTSSLFPEVPGLADDLVRCLENDLPHEDIIKDIVSRGPGVVIRVWSMACKPGIDNIPLVTKVHCILTNHVLDCFGVK